MSKMYGFVLYLVAAFAALATLLLEHIQQAIASEGPWFVALCIFVCLWLLWRRRNETLRYIQNEDESGELVREYGNGSKVLIAGIASVISAGLAQLIHSPYLGWLTFLLVIGLVFYAEYGKLGIKASLPVLILMVFIKPFPAMLEPWLQLGYQSLSTNLTMILLDFLKIFFYTEGNGIGLISQQNIAASLFSGVSWLYPSVFVAIAWGIYYRYHWLRTTLNVCQAIFWVVLWNAFGTTMLMANKEWGGSWMDSASLVMVSRYIVFALILFFLWSGDQFFSSMMNIRSSESAPEPFDPAKASSLQKPQWQLRGADWVLVIGMVAVCLVSIRLVSNYGWGWVHHPTRLAEVTLPKEVEPWKIKELEAVAPIVYGGSKVPVRKWSVENEDEKLILEIRGPSIVELPSSWTWQWNGWRVDRDTIATDEKNANDGYTFFKLSRLPGEACGLAIVGTNQYGSFQTADSALALWAELPAIAFTNLQRVIGIGGNQAIAGVKDHSLPPGHSVSLAWHAVRPLDQEKAKQLRNAWDRIFPLVRQHLVQPNSK